MLKFAVKQSHLNFTKNWATSELALMQSVPDTGVDLLASLFQENVEDTVDNLIQTLLSESDDSPGFENAGTG